MQKSKLSISLLVLALVMVSSNMFAGPAMGDLPSPDASSSALLLGLGFAGVAAVRRFIR